MKKTKKKKKKRQWFGRLSAQLVFYFVEFDFLFKWIVLLCIEAKESVCRWFICKYAFIADLLANTFLFDKHTLMCRIWFKRLTQFVHKPTNKMTWFHFSVGFSFLFAFLIFAWFGIIIWFSRDCFDIIAFWNAKKWNFSHISDSIYANRLFKVKF